MRLPSEKSILSSTKNMTSPSGKAPENYGLFTTLISSIVSFISRPCALSHHSQIIRNASFPGALHLRAGFEVRARVRSPRSTQSAPAERLRKAAHRTHLGKIGKIQNWQISRIFNFVKFCKFLAGSFSAVSK